MGEEHHAKLLGRIDVEPLPGQLEDALADARQLATESRPKGRSSAARVDADAGLLHAIEHGRQRQVDLGIHARDAGLLDLLAQRGNERMNRRSAAGSEDGGAWPLRAATSASVCVACVGFSA